MFVNRDIINVNIKIWLCSIFVLIVVMVVVGGLTRLTDSGLSITNWEIFSGILPPTSISDWNNYFSEYKKIPEFKLVNSDITLEEFKVIFYWEYAHRLLARFVGLISLIPILYLTIKYRNSFNYLKRYYLIFFLICLQGFIGWFMVKSGLVSNTDVSHFRLALHLFLALLILSVILWFIFDIFKIEKFNIKIPQFLLNILLLLIITQIILGAFLAGLNGGLIYNTWPDMNGNFYPNDIFLKDYFFFEIINNPSIIQFLHRVTAYVILFFLIILNYLYFKFNLNMRFIHFLNISIFLQIILGIFTLLSGVEIKFASLHQLGSIIVLSSYLLIFYKNS